MRILHVTRDFPPRSRGGISTAVGGLAGEAARRGHQVAVLSFDDWRPRRQGGAPATAEPGDVPVLRLSSPGSLPEARAFSADFAPDLVQVHHGMLWAEARELGARTLLHVHVDQAALNAARGVDEETLSLRAQRVAMAEADAVVTPTRAGAERLAERWGRPVGGVPLGVRPAIGRAGPGQGVISVGRFDRAKGTEDLLQAAPRLGAPLTLVGGVPGNPRAERRWLDALGGARSLGWLGAEERDAHLAAAAVAVQFSREETFGLAALEAMRLGVPVVAGDCPALRELLDGCGVLVRPGDVEGLVAAVRGVLADPGDLGGLGLERARDFAWDAVWPAWAAIYG